MADTPVCRCGHAQEDHANEITVCEMHGCRCTGYVAEDADEEQVVATFEEPEPLNFDVNDG